MTMTLSNAAHSAPGKAHPLAGKANAAGRTGGVTGLEFLTGEGADGALPTGGEGASVDFTALMQGIVQPAMAGPAGKAVKAPQPLVTEAQEGHDPSADAAALLAMALQNGHAAPPVVAGPALPKLPPEQAGLPLAEGAVKGGPDQAPVTVPVAIASHITVSPGGKAGAKTATKDADQVGASEGDAGGKTGGKAEGDDSGEAVVSLSLPQATPLILPETAQAQAIAGQAAIVATDTRPAPPHAEAGGDRRKGKRDGEATIEAAGSASQTGQSPAMQKLEREGGKQPDADTAETMLAQAKGGGAERASRTDDIKKQYKEIQDTIQNIKDNVSVAKAPPSPVEARNDGERGLAAREGDRAVAPSENIGQTLRADGPGQQTAQTASPASVSLSPLVSQPSATGTSVGGALNSQVVDMGVSGQWIEDIARQIASIGANPGHGSFRIESAGLGGVRVDIAPGAGGSGSDVLMRVDNDAAFAALSEDRDRLMQDARMGSVRIGELRIDRLAPAQDAQRSDMGGSSQQNNGSAQQQAASQSSMAQNSAQMGGQGGQQQARQDAASLGGHNQGGQNPKAPFTTTVLRGADADEANGPMRSGRGDSARYA